MSALFSDCGSSEIALSDVAGITLCDAGTPPLWDSADAEDVIRMLQDEHSQFVAITECFVHQLREQIVGHQRDVQAHYEKQVELARKIGRVRVRILVFHSHGQVCLRDEQRDDARDACLLLFLSGGA